jgi:hypothetical protein
MHYGDLMRQDKRALPLDGNCVYDVNASNVRAYIIDTGLRTTHVEFAGRATVGFDAFANDPTIGGARFSIAGNGYGLGAAPGYDSCDYPLANVPEAITAGASTRSPSATTYPTMLYSRVSPPVTLRRNGKPYPCTPKRQRTGEC